MAKQQILPGSPPILWSSVDAAFIKINANFDELYATIGGGTVVDFSLLNTDVSPNITETYNLGSATKRWKDLHLSGDSIYLGNAVISATGSSVNLPAGSTIGGNILDSEYFREIAVSGQSNLVADVGGTSVLTVAASSGIGITTDPLTDTLTFTNTGVVSNVAGAGIGVSGTGNVTISNTGVLAISAGSGITVSGTNANITIANAGIISVVTDPGSGISLDTSVPNTVRITNALPNINQDTYKNVAVSGQSTLVANSIADTLNLENGSGISITTNAGTDTVTFTNTGVTSLAVSLPGLGITASTGSVTLSNTGVTSISAGDGISISSGTGAVTVANNRYAFSNISVVGQDPLQADNGTDTLVLVAGNGIELLLDPSTDSVTISAEGNIKQSIFAENSTLLVDADNAMIVGDVRTSLLRTSETAIALGEDAGGTSQGALSIAIGKYAGGNQGTRSVAVGFTSGGYTQGDYAVAIGEAGVSNQGNYAVAIGQLAGSTNQGSYAVAIGSNAGNTNQSANSIIINASGAILDSTAAGFYVAPIREVTGPQVLYYDPTGKEITWGPVPAGIGGGVASDYEFNIAGDDSTQHVIAAGETVKFIGSGGISTSADSEGYVTISGSSIQQLKSRSSVSGTTASLLDAATGNLTITGFKGYLLYKIQTDAAAWVRIYTDTASRTADSGRSELTDPTPGSGVIAEVITTGAETVLISPGTVGFSNESSPSTNIELAVTNKSGGTTAVTVTLTVLQIEV